MTRLTKPSCFYGQENEKKHEEGKNTLALSQGKHDKEDKEKEVN